MRTFVTAFGRNASQRVMYEMRQATEKNRIQMPGELKIKIYQYPRLRYIQSICVFVVRFCFCCFCFV